MSVAFRREGDDEHLEPRFEIPIPPGPNLVTGRGLALIAERITALEAALVAAGGDPADAGRAAAPGRPVDSGPLAEIQRDLRYWRTRQATAQLTAPPEAEVAGFGSRVRFSLNGGPERTIDIVGDDEAEPVAGRIAFTAPLARALIGAEAGETVSFGGVEDAIELIAVTPIP